MVGSEKSRLFSWWGWSGEWGLDRRWLNRVSVVDVAAYVVEGSSGVGSIAVAPHPLIQVPWQLGCRDAFHRLEFVLRLCPVWFDRLRVDACHGINEIHAVVDSGIGVVYVRAELPVGSPLVAVYNRSVPNHPLDDGDEGLRPSVWHNLHVRYSRCRGSVADTKYPLLRCGSTATVVLGLVLEERLIDLHDDVPSAKKHRGCQQVRRADLSQELEVLLNTLARDVECVSSGFHWRLLCP